MAPSARRSPSSLRSFLERIDTAVDSALNRTFDPTKPVTAAETTKRAGRFARLRLTKASLSAGIASRRLSRLERRGRKYVLDLALMEGRRSPVEHIVRHPRLVIASCVVVSLILSAPAVFLFGSPALGIKSGMRADLEVFLPPDDPATQILHQIREDYSTDLVIGLFDLYLDGANITDVGWMKQISAFEGDVDAVDSAGESTGIDWRQDDIGQIDGVNWTLSIPTIVKVANVSTSNFLRALNVPGQFVPNSAYAVPNNQDFIDSVVDDIAPDQRSSLIVNRENRSEQPFNRLVVLFGLSRDLDQQEQVITRAGNLARALNEANDGVLVVRITGPVIVFRDLQSGVSKELYNAIPFILAGLIGVLYFWHRNWRVLVIALVPVSLASGVAYGVVGLAHVLAPQAIVLAPQVVLAAPMLLAIGVSYGLYIINRFVEEVGETRAERVTKAIVRINPAIFLSAVAMGIGFAALMIGTLPPIWSLGLALTVGIAFTYIFVYALIPSFLTLMSYEKKVTFKDWKRISLIPERRRVAIVLVSLMLVAASLGVLAAGRISFDVDYLTMTPENTPSVEAMRDYSNTMGGGQLGIVLSLGNFEQVSSLDELDKVQTGIDQLANVQTVSMVTLMKLIRSPEQISLRGVNITVPVNASFWDLLHSISSPSNQRDLLSLFYASIPPQMRAMLVDQEFASSVVFILMPFLPVDKTREAVNGVNGAIDAGASARTSTKILHMAGVQTVTLAVNDLIIQGQIISLIVALALTFIHIWLVFGDFRVAVLTMVPVTVVSTLEPLILVLLSIPLSTVTVMIGSIAIGTGVDFAVQITQRMRLEGYTQKSINEAVEKAGVSFVEATSTMVAGFAGMLAMNIVSIQQFVYMIIILLVLNMIAAMFLFPALGSIWVRRRKRAPPSVGLYVRMLRSLRDAVTEPRPRHAARATEREK